MAKTNNMEPKCWICGSIADTREHKTKKSDLKLLFGKPSQKKPLYYHYTDEHGIYHPNIPIGSLDNERLKFSDKMCLRCNSARTQPYDLAWEELLNSLWLRKPIPKEGEFIRTNRIFKCDTRLQMVNVHLYFVKHFGCRIQEGEISISAQSFSKAILDSTAHPCIYLKFGFIINPRLWAYASGIQAEASPENNCVTAYSYEVGKVVVKVLYIDDSIHKPNLRGLWHPKMGTTRLTCFNWDE